MDLANNEMKVIKHIENLIINNKIKFKLFFHYNQKYTINELLTNVFIILKKGMSFREIKKYTHIHWNTIYKFFIKLSKYNMLNDMYKDTINMYLNEINKMEINNNNFLYIDSSIVLNKYGIDNISINPQLKKHKSSKFSIITDDFGVPIDCNTYKSSINDAKIADMQINNIIQNHPLLCLNNKTLIGDAAYDSNKIRDKLKNNKIGVLLTSRNIRNTKNKEILNKQKPNFIEKMILNKRISVEHTINKYKQFKRINIRYDKKSNNYNTFLCMASYLIFNKLTHFLY